MGMIKKFDRFLVKSNYVVIGLTLFFMFIFVFINVITRYVFNFSINWAEELSRFLMIATCFLGIGIGMREGRHVAIEVFINLIPNQTIRRVIRLINGLIIIAFMITLTYLGFLYAATQFEAKSAVLRWGMGYIYLFVPIGALAFVMHLVLTIKDFMETESIEAYTDDVDEGGRPV